MSALSEDNSYDFRLAAVNSKGEGKWSNYATLAFSGWPKESVAAESESTVAGTVVIVIVIIILVIGIGALTTYLCMTQKKQDKLNKE